MMRLAILTDTHWGARSDSLAFLDYTKKFLDEVFFPYTDKHGIQYVFHLGDLVERRKYCNYYTAKRLRQDFLEPLREREISTVILAGNHDIFYKDTSKVNALHELVAGRYPYIKIFTEPAEIEIDEVPILLVPWINLENEEQTLKLIKKTKAQICFGHLDLTGFELRRGIIETDGTDPGLFGRFDCVLSGHFHHKHSRDNIHYLGAPLEFDWGDYNDPKGFHVFDTETRQVDFIENPFVIFKKIWYSDKDKTIQEVVHDFPFDNYSSCVCKLVVQEKTNPYWYDLFVDRLEKAGVSELQVVEDHQNLDMVDDEEIVAEAEDTFTIFKRAIEQMDDSIDKDGLVQVISELYQEAVALE